MTKQEEKAKPTKSVARQIADAQDKYAMLHARIVSDAKAAQEKATAKCEEFLEGLPKVVRDGLRALAEVLPE